MKKLTRGERELASRYIAEEIETQKYPRKQAIAIGLSRARERTKKTRRGDEISRIMSRYR
jgi:Family of unknown function (DUF6496)